MRGLLAPLIKLVVFILVTAAATYVLGATIANSSFGDTNTYKADFTDAAGLNVGDDVRVAGVRVGTVSDIKLVDEKQTGKRVAQVTFSVDKSRPLPKSVDITLRYRNLVGQRYIDIAQGTGDTGTLSPGSTVPSTQTHPAVDLTVLFQGFRPLFQGLDADQINSLATEIIQTLQGEGGSLELLLSTLADLSNSVADRDQVIGDVVNNLTSVLTTLGDRDTELSNLIVQLQGFISGLAEDRTTIGNAIDGINSLATQTAGLLTNVRAPLARDIKDVTGLVGVLNANSGTIKYVLQQLPGTVGALIRTASYGSWFNFYLCTTSLELPGADGGPGTLIQAAKVPDDQTHARCYGG
jgi:phospholipid/cholesterol/gamma-HCH transport system substrate-binding protein